MFKIKKNLIYILIFTSLTSFYACSEEEDGPINEVPYISIENISTYNIPAAGGKIAFNIKCPNPAPSYTISVECLNASVSHVSKSKSEYNYYIHVGENPKDFALSFKVYVEDEDMFGNIITTSFSFTQSANTNSGNNTGSNTGNNSGSSTGGNTGNNSGSSTGGNTVTKPSAPTNISCSNQGNNSIPQIYISWNSVSDATQYNVYRSSSSSSGYSKLTTTYSTNYTDYYPKDGYNYYKISAVNSAGESSLSSYTYYKYDSSSSAVPAIPSVSVYGSSTISVSWSCQTGSGYGTPTKYKVYKRDPQTSEFELLTTTSSTSYSDYDTHPGINRYAVIAVNSNGESGAGYGYSQSIELSKPTSFSASKSGSYVSFSWSKVNNATGYQIFYSTSAYGSYYILDQIDGKTNTSKTIYYPESSGTTIYFKIKAIYEAEYGGSIIYSDYTTYKSVTF